MNFNFQSIAHVFATVAADIVKTGKVVESVIAQIRLAQPEVESLTAIIAQAVPQAAIALPIERAAFASLGLLAHAVHSADDVAAANGLDVKLDAAFVAELKQILPALRAQAQTAGMKL
jgi:hypothetical protein